MCVRSKQKLGEVEGITWSAIQLMLCVECVCPRKSCTIEIGALCFWYAFAEFPSIIPHILRSIWFFLYVWPAIALMCFMNALHKLIHTQIIIYLSGGGVYCGHFWCVRCASILKQVAKIKYVLDIIVVPVSLYVS